MNTLTLKKVAAGAVAFATLAGTVYAAPVTFTGSVTGGATNTDVVWDGNYPGTATGSSTVGVTATVTPILTMALDATTLALGTLTTSAYNSGSVNITVATNAVGGADVTMTSVGLKDTVVGKEIGVSDIDATAQTAATDYYKVTTNAAPVFADVNDALANAGGTDVLASQVVYNGTTVAAADTTKVTVGAKIAATTEAGTYSDTLTFTVVGSF